MPRKRTPGLRKRGATWHIEKQIKGYGLLCESCKTSDLQEAERYLACRLEEIRAATVYGVRPPRTYREAATKYLMENQQKASIADDANHLQQMDPFIGGLRLDQVHDDTLRPFVDFRKAAGRKSKSINLALSVVRRILNLAARSWRDEYGLTWLETAPLITLLPVTDARPPYPLSWDEQTALFRELPTHLGRMALFKVNTGTREQEVCGLRWEWEVPVPELGTSVFLIPASHVKNREERLVALNDVAGSVLGECRGIHPHYVFTYRGHRVGKINNTAWKQARKRAGLPHVRVHDLKHTFGRRLRAAGVPWETRKVLLGHKSEDITTHYSAPEIAELLEAANRVCRGKSGKTPALTVLRRSALQ